MNQASINMKKNNTYKELARRFERLAHLSHLGSIASWDEAVNMPAGSGSSRSMAMAELGALQHELITDPVVKDLVLAGESEYSSLSDWEKANFREIKRQWRLTQSVDADLVKRAIVANMECQQAWRVLRAQNNWTDFKPLLGKVISLAQEEAQQRAQATGLAPYDALLDLYEPGASQKTVDPLFADLKNYLPPLIQKIKEKQRHETYTKSDGYFSIEKQKALGLDLMKRVGFDFNFGRLDVSHHPFCGGWPKDVRITTRFNEKDFTQSVMAVLHETGHASYEQNLPNDWLNQPVGRPFGMAIHEGQSLLFEMQIARSREFFDFSAPVMKTHLFEGQPIDSFWEPENLHKLYTRVEPSLIRVDADEVTYPAHVILRYEIEKDLIAKNIEVDDIPQLWHEKMTKYLGLSTQGDYKSGCMQDSHWPGGAFGYFPSYTLGAMVAAQLFAAIKRANPKVTSQISLGNFSTLRDWLTQNVWRWGSFYSLSELLTKVTGEPLSAQAFKTHIENRYLI